MPGFRGGACVVGGTAAGFSSPYSKRSFDSRYFGPVPLRCVLHRVLPLWTVESP